MGSSQSSRTLTVDNENDPTMILVCDSVVERLKGKVESSAPPKSATKPDGKLESEPPTSQPGQDNIVYIPQPYITSLEVKKEIAKELDKNNEYWENRLKQYQEHHEKMNKIVEVEYSKTLRALEGLTAKLGPSQSNLPCLDTKSKVENCYIKNTKTPLECNELVTEFSKCMSGVEAHRKSQAKRG